MLKFFNFFFTHKFIFVLDLCKLFFYQCFFTTLTCLDIVIDVFAATRGLLCYIIYAINNKSYSNIKQLRYKITKFFSLFSILEIIIIVLILIVGFI